uniref:DDE_Tnp_1_7 domain-containing protein n=1 Tax=Glossina pallidipes TaxID=7398 RepID=A0A1B0AFQ3_GLOPL
MYAFKRGEAFIVSQHFGSLLLSCLIEVHNKAGISQLSSNVSTSLLLLVVDARNSFEEKIEIISCGPFYERKGYSYDSRLQRRLTILTHSRRHLSYPQSVADVRSLFVGEDVIEKIVYETNRYHDVNNPKYKKHEHGCKCVDVTVSEMKKVFGLISLMGLIRNRSIPLFAYLSKYDNWEVVLCCLM